MKCQAQFSLWNNNNNKFKVSSAVAVVSILWVPYHSSKLKVLIHVFLFICQQKRI